MSGVALSLSDRTAEAIETLPMRTVVMAHQNLGQKTIRLFGSSFRGHNNTFNTPHGIKLSGVAFRGHLGWSAKYRLI
jgi:hypothetical protein